ncbi:MAG TPA: hypothetical protein VKN62_12130 [Pelovirga sp.]|nr:hypothetical protein [Pelovirga sp.]
MKKMLFTSVLLISLFLAACSGDGNKYGAGIDPEAPKVQVKDIFLRPDLIGQKVTLEGRIVSQCASNGCWFYLQDETGQVYVDLARNGFELPSLPNKTAIASGTIAKTQQAFLLIATGVEIK